MARGEFAEQIASYICAPTRTAILTPSRQTPPVSNHRNDLRRIRIENNDVLGEDEILSHGFCLEDDGLADKPLASASRKNPLLTESSSRGRLYSRRGELSLRACFVLAIALPSADAGPYEKLTPADPRDVETALALTNGRAMARSQGAETMSQDRGGGLGRATQIVGIRYHATANRRRVGALNHLQWPHTKPDELK
jgi:hypothetical protein